MVRRIPTFRRAPGSGPRRPRLPVGRVLRFLQERIDGLLEFPAAHALVPDDSLPIENENGRVGFDPPRGSDRPFPAVPPTAPGDLPFADRYLQRFDRLVRVDAQRGERLVLEPLDQPELVKVHRLARAAP